MTAPRRSAPIATRRLAARIALTALAAVAVAIAIVGLGVTVIGGQLFTDLMVAHGETAQASRQMFDQSVTAVLAIAAVIAAVASVALAVILARRLASPLELMGRAARRVADGDYEACVPREGPEELVMLADSFNQMAQSLGDQERLRRDFIANAAHELRTPLTNLQGYLEALRDGVIAADRQTYDSLWEEADRLVRLARSLDALAQGDRAGRPVQRIELDLVPALAAALELVRPGFEARNIALVRRWPQRLLVDADPDHLGQVLSNLLQNALRYTADGGRVTIAAETRGTNALVSIVNSGEPIPSDDLPHIFERFYRVEKSRDREHGGAGIGLAIVKQLVEAGGGRVGAESAGEETRFWFSLPARMARP